MIVAEGDANPPKPMVVGDTGPFLCGGLVGRDGITVLWRLSGRLIIPVAVAGELEGLAKASPSDDIRKAAAQFVAGRKNAFVQRDTKTVYAPSDVKKVLAEVVAAEDTLHGAGAKSSGHRGEVEAILLAEQLGAILLTNDKPAAIVAISRKLEVATYATLLAVEVREARLEGPDAAKQCEIIMAHTYPGTHRTDALQFTQLQIPDGL